MKISWWTAGVLSMGVLASACSVEHTGCLSGESRACACPDGRNGAQLCRRDGTLDPCVCERATDAGTVALDASTFDGGTDAGEDAAPDAGSGILVDFVASVGVHQSGGFVTGWDDQSGHRHDATTASTIGPRLTSVIANGRVRPALHFDGASYLVAEPHLPRSGTIVIVLDAGMGRALGWEDSVGGHAGIGLSGSYSGSDFLIVREAGQVGDIIGGDAITDVECDVISWGAAGVTFERHRSSGATLRFDNTNVRTVSDPGYVLHIGAPGDGPSTWMPMTGDIAALRVYERQLAPSERDAVAEELYGAHDDVDAGTLSDAGTDAGSTHACIPYAGALAGSLGADLAQAALDCATSAPCAACRAAGGSGIACGSGGTMETCVTDCIASTTPTSAALASVRAALAAGSVDLGCTRCYAGIPACQVAMSCLACPGGGCGCDVCQCERGCVDRFFTCAGTTPSLDCGSVHASC